MRKRFLLPLILISLAVSEDGEIIPGYFKSENNIIEEIHFEMAGGKSYAALKLKNKLSGKNARSRNVQDRQSNYGDSASAFAYVELSREDPAKSALIQSAYESQSSVDLIYNCGEQPDDRKRKVFPFYAEMNCEIIAITFKKAKEKRGYGY